MGADATDPERSREPGSDVSSEALFAALYAEVRRIADRESRRRADVGVSATTLVHEAYLRLSGRPELAFADRGRFLAYAARAIRTLIVDAARERRALKRGAAFHITRLGTHSEEEVAGDRGLEALSEAIDHLRVLDPRLAEVVDLKYFCGLSFAEIATARGSSERTVQRDWEKARLLLFRELTGVPTP